MNLLILEGPDGAGKSMLAEQLAVRGYHVEKFGVPPKEARRDEESLFQFFFGPLVNRTLDSPQVRLAFDRFHLSDRIYGPVMRGGTPMTLRAEHLIERYVEARDGQVVICLPPYRVAFANWLARRGQEYVTQAVAYRHIYEDYARLLFNQKRNHHFLWYDYTRHQGDRFADALMKFEGRPLPAGLVGSQRARFLVLGERASTPYDLPFMTTRGYSGWFHDALTEAGYHEPELAFANAYKKDGTPWLSQALYTSLAPTLITLGEYALGMAANAGVTNSYNMPHPQYFKRFRTKERNYYIRRLAAIRRNSP